MVEGDTKCGTCGLEITDEPAGVERKPCPRCGSTARRAELHGTATAHAFASAQLTVVEYPQKLLATAKRLLEEGEFGIAVVVAHMACEIATERCLSAGFAAKGLQYLEEAVLGFISGYNLANDRIRDLYTALTGDPIEKQPFWSEFKNSATRRNGVVHGAKTVVKSEAEASHRAAAALVAHVKTQ